MRYVNPTAPVMMSFVALTLILNRKQRQVGRSALMPNTRRDPLFGALLATGLILWTAGIVAKFLDRTAVGSLCFIPMIVGLTVLGLRSQSAWLAVASDRLPPEFQFRAKSAKEPK